MTGLSEAGATTMLDTLGSTRAKRGLFVNGYRARRTGVVRLIADRGHDRQSFLGSRQSQETRCRRNRAADHRRADPRFPGGEAPRFFRPPHAGNDAVRQIAAEQGLLYMTWSDGSLDWDAHPGPADLVVANVLAQLHPGANVLMHELP